MTCQFPATAFAPPSAAPRRPGLARRWWHAYWSWRARKATVFILRSLDQRTLHDIGISSGEIESLVYGSGDRRRRYDATWPGQGA
jgi:uncharacterized protein YjiS (DUF1127 family)